MIRKCPEMRERKPVKKYTPAEILITHNPEFPNQNFWYDSEDQADEDNYTTYVKADRVQVLLDALKLAKEQIKKDTELLYGHDPHFLKFRTKTQAEEAIEQALKEYGDAR